jgi:RND family efflux transporter MFP subunit
VQPGALVQAAGTPLTTVVAAGDLLVRASVAEQDWPLLAAARTAGRISAEVRDKHATEGLARGELVFIDNQIDPASGAVAIKVRLIDPPPSLLSGQALPLRLTLGVEPGARAVPDAAVQVGQNGSFVYVVRDGKAVAQAVQALRSLDGMTQIAGDVRAGEAVLVEIPKRLRDGSLVKLARVAGDAGKSGARSGGKPSSAP